MKQDERATITIDIGLRDEIKMAAAREKISIYEFVQRMFRKYTVEGIMLK